MRYCSPGLTSHEIYNHEILCDKKTKRQRDKETKRQKGQRDKRRKRELNIPQNLQP